MTWKLGDTSRKYEVGKGGPATVSSGQGDHGGVSYGMYQLSSKMGTAAKFVQVMGYTAAFKKTVPGTPAFSAIWKELAKNPEFGEAQHEFIKRSHYNPQINFLKQKNIDLSSRGPAVQDAVWSTSVQFGGGTSLILNALAPHRPVDKLTDTQIVTFIQDFKIANNDRLFKSSSPAVRAGVLDRAKREKADLCALAKQAPPQEVAEPAESSVILAAVDAFFDNLAAIGSESERNS